MSSRDVPETVLNGLDETRRSFITKLIVSAPFAAPVVASFSMTALSVNDARAQVSNVTSVPTTSPVGLGAAAAGLLATGAALLWRGLDQKADDAAGDDGSK